MEALFQHTPSGSPPFYIFGDQTYDVSSALDDLLHIHRNPILSSFVEKSYHVLRTEIGKLSPQNRKAYPSFSNIADLLSAHRKGTLNAALLPALTCITQLGLFIQHVDRPGRRYPDIDVGLLGLCTGTLSTAAISCCKSAQDLLNPAVQAVAVAFRFGLLTSEASNRIERDSVQQKRCWGKIVAGATIAQITAIIEEYLKSRDLPQVSTPYISASAPNGVTISGPPAVLNDLAQQQVFSKFKVRDLPLYAAYHAPHIYRNEDISWILQTTPAETWSRYGSNVPVISSVTGKTVWSGDFRSLLENSLKQCLIQQLRWDTVVKEMPETLRSRGQYEVELLPVATNAFSSLQNGLKGLIQATPHDIAFEVKTDVKQGSDHEKIAIVGYSGRFPDADSPDEFWQLLHDGLDVVSKAPPVRWNTDTHTDSTGKKKNVGTVPWGCWLQTPGLFDPRFFGMSPKEAPQIDPQQRLACLTAYEAMEEAGLVIGGTPSTQKDRIGVFLGSTSNDWLETNSSQDIGIFYIPGGNRAFTPGRVNYVFKLTGPSYSVDTACSSSLASIHLACNALWRKDCDTVITGGTNVLTNPDFHVGLDRGHFLSKTGNCKTFDDSADGYCRGEGAVSIIMKRLDDAIADKDPIHAVVLGTNTNHSSDSDAIVRPYAPAQRFLMEKVMNHIGSSPEEVDFVELHGTGTQAGDAIEMQSVLETFANTHNAPRTADNPLYLGSVKANIGHGESVSGASSLTKLLLMMKNDEIPPHAGIKTKINHNYPTDMDERHLHIARKPTPWPRKPGKPRRALINNFSAAGGNTALVMEDAPEQQECLDIPPDPRSSYVVTTSGKSATAVQGNIENLIKYIDDTKEPEQHFLSQLSYTTTARRMHHPHRVAVTGTNLEEIKANLQKAADEEQGKTRAKNPPRILFAFTGQGSQYFGMGQQLFDQVSSFRAEIVRLNHLAQGQGFPSFEEVFTADNGDIDNFPPVNVQLASVCLQVALVRLFESYGVSADAVVGHSLGEYAALNVAGVLSDSDMIHVAGKRAELLQKYCNRGTHSMLAIKAPLDKLTDLFKDQDYQVACINGPEDTVLAGTNATISKLQKTLGQHSIKGRVLSTPYAFHSSQVDPIAKDFEKAAKDAVCSRPSIPVITPLEGKIVTEDGYFNGTYFVRHCRESVNMHKALLEAKKVGLVGEKTITIEIGPQAVVSVMIKATLGTGMQTFPTLGKGKDTWPLLTAALAATYSQGYDIHWSETHRDFEICHKVLRLPRYSWDLKDYWMTYHGDWSLRKGETLEDSIQNAGLKVISTDGSEPPSKKIESAPKAEVREKAPLVDNKAPKKPETMPASGEKPEELSTTTVQKVISVSSDDKTATLVAESDISREDLYPVVQGHKVNGIPLATPSVFADMTLTIGKHLLDCYQPNQKERLVDVGDLVAERVLIPHGNGPQRIRATATADWSKKTVKCTFSSINENGKVITDHAHATAAYKDDSKLKELQKQAAEIQARMKELENDVTSGQTKKFNSDETYEKVAILAEFHPDYRGIEQNILDGKNLEVVTTLGFHKVKEGGKFSTHPAYVDALTQPGGFIMNGKDSTNLKIEVYVNHGWDSLQIFEPIRNDRLYKVYVKMNKIDNAYYSGDNIVFDAETGNIVAFLGKVTLRRFPRKAFAMILQYEDPSKTNTPSANEVLRSEVKPAPASNATPQKAKPSKEEPAKPAEPEKKEIPKKEEAPKKKKEKKEKKPKPAPKQVTKPTSGKSQQALEIIADETGLDMTELTDDADLNDLGVDSLLSMVITSRYKEELEMDIDDELNIVDEFPNIKSIKDWFNKDAVDNGEVEVIEEEIEEEESESSDEEEEAEEAPPPKEQVKGFPLQPEPTAVTAAPQPDVSLADSVDGSPKAETKKAPAVSSISKPTNASSAEYEQAIAIIAEETGLATEDLTEESDFADLGVDSLLSMVISSRYKEELGMELDDEFSIFLDFPTVGDLKKFFLSGSEETTETKADLKPPMERSSSSSSAGEDSEAQATPDSASDNGGNETETTVPPEESEPENEECKPASSVILQGKIRAAKTKLFMFPDGGGTASSYITLPRLGEDIVMLGLNCPYVRDAENMKCSIYTLIDSYVTEIRRRQPTGPYNLGGWSSGGIFAFIAAHKLLKAGEEVDNLIMIDSPIPNAMDNLPLDFYDWCEQLRLFGMDEKAPEFLIAHFKATVNIMEGYTARAIPKDHAKKVKMHILWAGQSLLEGQDEIEPYKPAKKKDEDNYGLKFLLGKKTEFGTAGWEKLLPGADIHTEHVDGANHFTLMTKDNPKRTGFVQETGKFISKVLS